MGDVVSRRFLEPTCQSCDRDQRRQDCAAPEGLTLMPAPSGGAGWRGGALQKAGRRGGRCHAEGVWEHDDVIYSACMTEMLEEAIAKVRKLPEADQDEAAAMLLSVASKNDNTVELDEGTRRAIREGRSKRLKGSL
jgi:hypothetical protein